MQLHFGSVQEIIEYLRQQGILPVSGKAEALPAAPAEVEKKVEHKVLPADRKAFSFPKGTRIKALWKDGRWYAGTAMEGGQFIFDDGDMVKSTPHKSVIEMELLQAEDLLGKKGMIVVRPQPEQLRIAQEAKAKAKAAEVAAVSATVAVAPKAKKATKVSK